DAAAGIEKKYVGCIFPPDVFFLLPAAALAAAPPFAAPAPAAAARRRWGRRHAGRRRRPAHLRVLPHRPPEPAHEQLAELRLVPRRVGVPERGAEHPRVPLVEMRP